MQQLLLFSALLLLALQSCQQAPSSQSIPYDEPDSLAMPEDNGKQKMVIAITEDPRHDRAKLHSEVMKLHDTTMPKMPAVNRMIRRLKALGADEQSGITASQHEHILRFQKDLEGTEDGMFDWMANFREPAINVPHEEAMAYLNDQKNQMAQIDSMIDATLKAAEEWLASISN